jgi:hypothetical protein
MNKTFYMLAAGAALVVIAGCGQKLPVNRAPNLVRAEIIRADIDAGGAAAAAGPVLVEPTGWATLTGRFKVNGTPTPDQPLKVDKDQNVCAPPGGMAPVAGTVLLSGDGGLKNVLVFLSTNTPADDPDKKWEHPDYAANKEATLAHPFDQKNCVFLDRIYAMRATQTTSVKNSDSVSHNANIQPRSGAKVDNFNIPPGGAVNYKPGGATNDPFQVTCSIHTWMQTWMISRPNPYFAVTDADGNFKIENLPAAEGLKLEFRGWHERAGFLGAVTVNGTAATWKKGKFELELKPGDTQNLEVTLDAAVLK